MVMNHSGLVDAELPESAGRLIGRFFFGTASGAALVSAIILWMLPTSIEPELRVALVASLVLFAAVTALAAHHSARPRFPMSAALCAAAVLAMALTGFVSFVVDAVRVARQLRALDVDTAVDMAMQEYPRWSKKEAADGAH